MANIKISELVEFTGDTTGAWLVMNNSGETTTFKVLKENLFSGGTGGSGSSGSSGTSGTSGTSGANGAPGSSGSSGTSGTSGANGAPGSSGSSGTSGTSGVGSSGSSGTSGTSGTSGVAGSSGSSGTSGTSGVAGSSGSSGTSGTSGTSGSNGSSGTSGTGFVWEGTWVGIATYQINDIVYYNGSSYVALTNNIGQQPDVATSDWALLALAGSSGSSGTSGTSGTGGGGGSSLFISGSAQNSVVNQYYASGDTTSPNSLLIGGTGNTITSTGENNVIVGGQSHTMGGSQSDNVIIGGNDHNLGACEQMSIIGGNSVNTNFGFQSGYIGCSSVNSFTSERTIFGGIFNSTVQDARAAAMVGIDSSNIQFIQNSIVGGVKNTAIGDQVSAAHYYAVLADDDSNISRGFYLMAGANKNADINIGNFQTILGTSATTISLDANPSSFTTVIGSSDSTIGSSAGNSLYNTIIGSRDGGVDGPSRYGTVIGSDEATITGSNEKTWSSIIGSVSSTIDGNANLMTNASIFNSTTSNITMNGRDGRNQLMLNTENSNLLYSTYSKVDTSLGVKIEGASGSLSQFNTIEGSNGGEIYHPAGAALYNSIRNSNSSNITGTTSASWNSILASTSSNIWVTTGDYNTIIGANASNISGTTVSRSTIIGSSTAIISGNNINSLILNASASRITGTTGSFNTIISSSSARIGGSGSSINNLILNSSSSIIENFGGGDESSIIGGFRHKITGNTSTQYDNVVLGGTDDNLYDTFCSTFIGSSASTISGGTIVVGIGLDNRVIDTPLDRTTYVENQYTYKTKSFGVINAGSVSGTIDVDLSLGTLFYFTITGNTTPNFINWREGQQIQFWVDNDGSHTVPTATISGGGVVYAKAGSINPTNNEITGYYGTIINGNMFLDEHLNFQAV